MANLLDNLPKETIQKYYEMGRAIGTSTDQTLDLELIRELTDAHRIINGYQPAKEMLVYDSPFAACKAIPTLKPSNAFFGSMDAGWLITALCAKNEAGYAETATIEALIELTKHVGWFWMSTTHTVVTYRPTEIHLIKQDDGTEVLHNYDDLAMKFRDGTGVAVFNGVRIPKQYHWLLKPTKELKKKDIDGIENEQVREQARIKFKSK
jgi:hypothetical protein